MEWKEDATGLVDLPRMVHYELVHLFMFYESPSWGAL
jgi:hypothetical protein